MIKQINARFLVSCTVNEHSVRGISARTAAGGKAKLDVGNREMARRRPAAKPIRQAVARLAAEQRR